MGLVETEKTKKSAKSAIEAMRGQKEGLSSIEKRGVRLKRLRLMTGLSRKDIEKKYNSSANTIRSWEDGLRTGLTEQGARRILSALKEEGIHCSLGWLLNGEGSAPDGVMSKLFEQERPQFQSVSSKAKSKRNKKNDREEIQTELATFCNLHTDAIYLEVNDDGMEPFYKQGDYVAGIRRYDAEMDKMVGKNCIIETQKGESYVRQLKFGSKPGHYNLICLNTQTNLQNPMLYDVELIYAAPVIWHRAKKI